MTGRLTKVTGAITAQNTFTDWLVVDGGQRFSLNVWGTFAGVVTLQKTYDGGTTILDDDITHTSPVNRTGIPQAETAQFRIGIKTGQYTSGTANVRLGRK